MALSRLTRAPRFTAVRTEASPAADAVPINDTNYPPADAVQPAGAKSILLHWVATGAAWVDYIDLQVLVRDGISDQWVEGPKILGLQVDTDVKVDIGSAELIYIRIAGVVLRTYGAGVTDLSVMAAMG